MHYYLKSSTMVCMLRKGLYTENVQILQYDLHSYGDYDIL